MEGAGAAPRCTLCFSPEMGDDGLTMGQMKRVVWAALLVMGVIAIGCNDEKKPPLTPDGPDMVAPDAGDMLAAPAPAMPPTPSK